MLPRLRRCRCLLKNLTALSRAARAAVNTSPVASLRPAGAAFDTLEPRTLFSGPTASLTPPATVATPVMTVDFTVTYNDDVGIDPATLGVGDPNDPGYPTSPADLTVNGPNGYSMTAVYLRPATPPGVQPSLAATYRIIAPDGRFTSAANGTYTVSVNGSAVADGDGNQVASGSLGSFQVNLPVVAGGDFAGGFGTDFAAEATAVASNGKILVAGSETYARFGEQGLFEDPNLIYSGRRDVIRRYNPDGSIDTSFGTGGRVVLADGNEGVAYAILPRPDGSFYVAGSSGFPSANVSMDVTHYNADGTLDIVFGNQGTTLVDFDGSSTLPDVAHAIALQSDGKIIVAGETTTLNGATPETDFAICRLNTDGSLDSTFGTSGLVMTDMSGAADSAGALVVGPSDEIIVAGAAGDHVGVARYTASGALDTTFDTDGKLVLTDLAVPLTSGSTRDFRVGLARLADGSLVAAGSTADGKFAVERLNPDGSAATGFGTNGVATVAFTGQATAERVVVLPSGKLLVLGNVISGGSVSTAVAALTSSGAVDSTFGAGGKQTYDSAATTTSQWPGVSADSDATGNVLLARAIDDGSSQLRRLPADYSPPTASLATVADITSAGGAGATLTVTYEDDVAVDASSIQNNPTAVTVTGPSGPLTVTLQSINPTSNAGTITATYSVAAPGGTWDAASNGTYTVAIAGNKVADAGGANFVAAGTLGTFHVNIVPGAPTAVLSPVQPITTPGGATQGLVVTYTAPNGRTVDASSIDMSDLTVMTAGGQPLAVTGVSVSGSGATVQATYTVAAPGGSWDQSDNGDYVVSLAANQVSANGTFAPGAVLGSFTVNTSGSDGGDTGTPIGDFGIVSGKRQRLTFTDADGTKITFALNSGTGHAVLRDGRIDLTLDGTTAASSLAIRGKGGDGRVLLGRVTAAGPLKALTAPTADVTDGLTVAGDLRKATLGSAAGMLQVSGGASTVTILGNLTGNLTTTGGVGGLIVRGNLAGSAAAASFRIVNVRGALSGLVNSTGTLTRLTVGGGSIGQVIAGGTIAQANVRGGLGGALSTTGVLTRLNVRGDLTATIGAAAGISSLVVAGNVNGAMILAGANLGSDGQVGGTDAAADTYGAGALSTIKVSGMVSNSLFGAGLDPVNGVFLDSDDRVIGVADSVMRKITVKGGIDNASRFVAGAFGPVRAPGPVDVTTDPRFKVL